MERRAAAIVERDAAAAAARMVADTNAKAEVDAMLTTARVEVTKIRMAHDEAMKAARAELDALRADVDATKADLMDLTGKRDEVQGQIDALKRSASKILA
jgi:hypothetical protein